jgi:hypothetical protein
LMLTFESVSPKKKTSSLCVIENILALPIESQYE